jgi:hypothetical protein
MNGVDAALKIRRASAAVGLGVRGPLATHVRSAAMIVHVMVSPLPRRCAALIMALDFTFDVFRRHQISSESLRDRHEHEQDEPEEKPKQPEHEPEHRQRQDGADHQRDAQQRK